MPEIQTSHELSYQDSFLKERPDQKLNNLKSLVTKKSDEGRKITTSATPSESDTDTASKRTHKQATTADKQGAIVVETSEETEETGKKLNRAPVKSTEISLHLPKIKLDLEGKKLRYFIGSSTGTVAQGVLIPGDETNWSQDIHYRP